MIELPPPLLVPEKPAIIRHEPRQSNFLPGMFPAAITAGAGQWVDIEYIGAVSSTANREEDYTFDNVPIGAESDDRVLVFGVLCVGSGDTAVFGLQVDGVSAIGALPNQSRIHNESNHPISFFTLPRPTGTTATVLVTFGIFRELPNVIVFVWTVRNAASPFAFSAGAIIGSAASAQISLTSPERGAIAFAGGHQNTSAATYSSAELVDAQNIESRIYSAAQIVTKKEDPGFTETRSWSGSANMNFAGISFVPRDTKYPVLLGNTRIATNLNNTPSTLEIPMPSGVEPGDILAIVANVRGGSNLTAPAGWTQLLGNANGNITNHKVFYKIAEGFETSVILNAGGGARWAVHVYRIGNHTGKIEGTSAVGTSASPAPPSFSPSWGDSTAFWIISSGDTINPGTDYMGELLYPPGFWYGTYIEQVYLGNIYIKGVGAVRSEKTGTLTPDPFQIITSGAWVTSTIAIR